ncbi:DUF2264 domain-containing protein [Amycolatopsis cihanbeyliensis]|uniref:Uncharacterized protein DUF2264 n=1 Tax=Amycolatopsis cihanbeyliensis TaxID=1128664 RepID=A0A542DQ41_AMYCI|nr:DUF2264 domain-containing protein [Amycolatopsis cihanbeyliensis]TQJ05223.1 uncharacterized protein DUF2264 [Amycolatopsis cihanbeyliensis]
MKLPPEDRALSPYTGYTRNHWVAAADGLLEAAWRWSTPGGALLDLPGPASANGARSDGLEGFARTFLAAGFRVAGEAGADPHGWLDRYARGLDAGTRTPGRDGAESWPVILDYDVAGQPMVESASVALGLRLTRPWLWDTLDGRVRDRIEGWLRGALRHVPSPNNWHLFPYTVAGFLESVGRGDAETARARDRALELLEGWYRGHGWYADGDGRAFDYYNGWALHLYPVLDAHLAGVPTALGARLREHLGAFALWFGGDGSPIHFGRSLTYRFGAGAAVGLGAITAETPLRPGVSRRLLSGALRYFVDRGAVGEDGLLSLGWHGPHRPTVQFYSGPGSPYWASKAFVCLLAPPQHPLWTAREEPAPSEVADTALALPTPGLLLQSTASDGVVRLHNHGSDHVRPREAEAADGDDPHYGRFAYSTRTGPTTRGNVADNHFAVVVGGVRSVRRRIHPLGAGQGDGWGWGASWHRPIFGRGPAAVPGLRVESVTVARGRDEVRVHRVVGAPPGARAEQTGWATGPGESVLRPLAGWSRQDEVRAPHGTAYVPWAVLPCLSADVLGTGVLAALAVLGAEAGDPVASATIDGVEIRWPDGFAVAIRFDPLDVVPG